MSGDNFDFGFTAVDEDELEAVQEAHSKVDEKTAEVAERMEGLYNSILPLLENLRKNSDKDYIYWPNRTEKIDAFQKHLDSFFKDL